MTVERLTSATPVELDALSALYMRSKAHWGYDPAFLESRRHELTIRQDDFDDMFAVTRGPDGFTAFAKVILSGTEAELDHLFVDPDHIGQGLGRVLFAWACAVARGAGATALLITSDPHAEPFYHRLGATTIGAVPSEPPVGRTLPRLRLPL